MNTIKTLTPFQQKAIDFSKHISLTANAGSGKTFVLSNRFVEIAVNQDIPLSSIIAITFTDKAAGELYKKIAEEIDLRLANEKEYKILRRLEEIRRHLVSSNISTIHSFCINVLKEFSPEAGIDANFSPADETLSNELLDLSIEELFNIHNSEMDLDERVKQLIRYFGSKTLLVERLRKLLKNRKNVLEIESQIYSQDLDTIEKHFELEFEEKILQILPNISDFVSVVETINNKVKDGTINDNTIDVDNAVSTIRNSQKITEKLNSIVKIKKTIITKTGVRSVKYLSKKNRAGLDNEIESITKYFREFDKLKYSDVDASLNRELAVFGKLVLEIFDFVLSIYDEKKKKLSVLDFEDILLKTRDVLKNEYVRAQLNLKYKYIMVDEYQDTNEIQYDIIMPILKYLGEGNLFIVGDEKQSIYRFRDAEPEIFRRTTKKIIETEDDSSNLNLPHSFRVAPSIAFFVNTVFSELFSNYNPEYNEVGYDELLCARGEDEEGQVELLLVDIENDTETESSILTNKIISLCQTNLSSTITYGDIAVLCRKRSVFIELEKSFIHEKIPYAITGGKGFFQRQSIYDIFNFISFVLNPDDDIALFGVLRSPFYLLPDTELFKISLVKGNTFYRKYKNYSSSNSNHQKIIEQLKSFSIFGSTSTPLSLLRKILNETGYWSVAAAKPNSQQELANIEKLLHVANGFTQQGFHTLYDFKEYLSDAIDRIEDESQALINSDENSVKIMTIHQAKGLEFDTVFLYKCNDSTKSETISSKELYVNKKYGLLAKIPKEENYFGEYLSAPILSIYNYETTRKRKAEIKRLLYVAVTRAINNLIITGSHKKYSFKEDSFLQLIAEALKTDFSENSVPLIGKLQFMKSAEDNYETYFKDMIMNLSISTESIPNLKLSGNETNLNRITQKYINEPIIDYEKEEIISATKIAYFRQCPVKYQLTYEFGYSKVKRLVDVQFIENEVNFREDSEEENLPADVKGRIIHAILEKEISLEEIKTSVKQLLLNEYQPITTDANIEKYCRDIYSLMQKYYSSSTFTEINRYKNFKNEFEIYLKVEDYYLYGIIDKLIIKENELVIIDYKTDNILADKILNRAQNYIPQLMFYSFIVNNIFNEIKNIKFELIFLNQPEKTFIKEVTSEDLEKFGSEIKSIISKIRHKNFTQNLEHCVQCHLSDVNNNCPVK